MTPDKRKCAQCDRVYDASRLDYASATAHFCSVTCRDDWFVGAPRVNQDGEVATMTKIKNKFTVEPACLIRLENDGPISMGEDSLVSKFLRFLDEEKISPLLVTHKLSWYFQGVVRPEDGERIKGWLADTFGEPE